MTGGSGYLQAETKDNLLGKAMANSSRQGTLIPSLGSHIWRQQWDLYLIELEIQTYMHLAKDEKVRTVEGNYFSLLFRVIFVKSFFHISACEHRSGVSKSFSLCSYSFCAGYSCLGTSDLGGVALNVQMTGR